METQVLYNITHQEAFGLFIAIYFYLTGFVVQNYKLVIINIFNIPRNLDSVIIVFNIYYYSLFRVWAFQLK